MNQTWQYMVKIEDPQQHLVKVRIKGKRQKDEKNCQLFLPTWSPGSYLIREYSAQVQRFFASTSKGVPLYFEQIKKNQWQLDFSHPELKSDDLAFEIQYSVYLHQLSVRTADITEDHAFLHGPHYLMGVEGHTNDPCEVELQFPPLWSKVTTSLEDISTRREVFLYRAQNYHQLLDSPIEIGCHETDGFRINGIDHHLAFRGRTWPHPYDLKADIKKICEHINSLFGQCPFPHYHFLSHLEKEGMGGLEHAQGSVLQADGSRFFERFYYLNWLSLVAHEYFHAWNGKKIGPSSLLFPNYHQESDTSMLWLVEGLTTCYDEWLVFRSQLASETEYLKQLAMAINTYLETPGRYLHSLEEASSLAWIKLYRPDENSINSTVSYYLKGRLVFWCLHGLLVHHGSHLDDFTRRLWKLSSQNEHQGVERRQVLKIIHDLIGDKNADEFEQMLTTTMDIDFSKYLEWMGLEIIWDENKSPYAGMSLAVENGIVMVKSVLSQGPAQRAGVNAGDELLALEGMRIYPQDLSQLWARVQVETNYSLLLCRRGQMIEKTLRCELPPKRLKEIVIKDPQKALIALSPAL